MRRSIRHVLVSSLLALAVLGCSKKGELPSGFPISWDDAKLVAEFELDAAWSVAHPEYESEIRILLTSIPVESLSPNYRVAFYQLFGSHFIRIDTTFELGGFGRPELGRHPLLDVPAVVAEGEATAERTWFFVHGGSVGSHDEGEEDWIELAELLAEIEAPTDAPPASLTPPPRPAWFGTAIVGWDGLSWGMPEEEIPGACEYPVEEIAEPDEYRRMHCTLMVARLPFGRTTFEALFQIGDASMGLEQILLTHPLGAIDEDAEAKEKIREEYEHAYAHLVSLYGEPTAELKREIDDEAVLVGFSWIINYLWELDESSIELSLFVNKLWHHLDVRYFATASDRATRREVRDG